MTHATSAVSQPVVAIASGKPIARDWHGPIVAPSPLHSPVTYRSQSQGVLLLDAHLLLWATFEPERLSPKAARQLRSRESLLAFSIATLWEVKVKTSMGQPASSVDPRRPHQGLLAETIAVLPIQSSQVTRVASLP